MHRVTKESGLTDSANGSMAKDTERLRSTTKGAATSALTKCAFSWKFAYPPSSTRERAWIDTRRGQKRLSWP
jgi:hypothetical protein